MHCAFRRGKTNEYHLFISNDTNTLGYNQWFYFAVSNMRKGVTYSFKIVNYVMFSLARKSNCPSIGMDKESQYFHRLRQASGRAVGTEEVITFRSRRTIYAPIPTSSCTLCHSKSKHRTIATYSFWHQVSPILTQNCD